MAVTTDDLKVPDGNLASEMFPNINDFDAALQAWIDDGSSRSSSHGLSGDDADDATKEWAYHRAYLTIYLRISSDPVDVDLEDQASRRYELAQAKEFKALADEHKDRFEILVAKKEEAHVGFRVRRPARKETRTSEYLSEARLPLDQEGS